ncbi:DNA mismatch repair endonuclease MutL [Bacillus horti]|uniref:DNA mismatch repair protein MutL n=1 Tax=Caldalkalibacillus horti TaxID=77523 RepID=A0ABT9VV04_9BACI|nr:DNA mismatch repair endonuclease MutL [Bacillus horti]MDQ0164821.1 DNA mismatch repair protein MutL [Bacillus horti]
MAKIEIMDEYLSNKIAAGEVIERPASVVKELLENAIDAGSTRIEIIIEEGGLSRIKIIDNGHGMERADATMAFARHATSKLKSDKQLFQIMTLGFRGEALPSISSVSHVTLQTWDGEEAVGTEIQLEGGKVIHVEDAPLRKGTRIEVTQLFYNTPARYKYLKSIHTELSHITDYVNRLALAHPHIAFILTHNGRELLSTNGKGEVLQVLAAIYGPSIAKQMIPFYAQDINYTVNAYLGKPELTRSNRQYISVIINGRYLKNYAISQAILRAYHTLLPINRYPIVLLSIEMDPSLLDINVHPAKLEARLSMETELADWLEKELKNTLHQAQLIPTPLQQLKIKQPVVIQEKLDLRLPQREWGNPANTPKVDGSGLGRSILDKDKTEAAGGATSGLRSTLMGEEQTEQIEENGNIDELQDQIGSEGMNDLKDHVEDKDEKTDSAHYKQVHEFVQDKRIHDEQHENAGDRTYEADDKTYGADGKTHAVDRKTGNKADHDLARKADHKADGETYTESEQTKAKIPLLAPLGQLHGTYILAQNEQGLYMIDQHAAQERIWYEHFYQKLNEPSQEIQELLIPFVLEFTAGEDQLLQEHLSFLEHIGLTFEEFGHHSYRLRSHPNWFPDGEEEGLVREILDLITQQKKQLEWIYFREKVAIMMSCKQAIKANHYLTYGEMEALLEQLRISSNPFTCPHGRPITVLLSTYDIEKMFKRVMS